VMIAVVLAASSAYGVNREVHLTKGQSTTVNGYTLTYLGSYSTRSAQKNATHARVRITKGDRDLGVYTPMISTFPNSTDGIGTPSVRTGVVDDVYLTLVSGADDKGRVTIGVRVNTMIVWLWIGGAVMALGTVLAIAPRLGRKPREKVDPAGPDGVVDTPSKDDKPSGSEAGVMA
jgi:cytochrome c-type biogenesis protein CcmF